MSTYIATFFAHIGAVRFNKIQTLAGNESKMMPVPRSLSSSCGTCVKYIAEEPLTDGILQDEIEQIVLVNDFSSELPVYTTIFSNQ